MLYVKGTSIINVVLPSWKQSISGEMRWSTRHLADILPINFTRQLKTISELMKPFSEVQWHPLGPPLSGPCSSNSLEDYQWWQHDIRGYITPCGKCYVFIPPHLFSLSLFCHFCLPQQAQFHQNYIG